MSRLIQASYHIVNVNKTETGNQSLDTNRGLKFRKRCLVNIVLVNTLIMLVMVQGIKQELSKCSTPKLYFYRKIINNYFNSTNARHCVSALLILLFLLFSLDHWVEISRKRTKC